MALHAHAEDPRTHSHNEGPTAHPGGVSVEAEGGAHCARTREKQTDKHTHTQAHTHTTRTGRHTPSDEYTRVSTTKVQKQLHGLAYHDPSILPAKHCPERSTTCARVRECGDPRKWRRAVFVFVVVVVVVVGPQSCNRVSAQVLATG